MPHCANTASVAVVCAVQDTIKYATSIPRESVVDIRGIVKLAPTPIGSATQSLIEVHIEEVSSVSEYTCKHATLEDSSKGITHSFAQVAYCGVRQLQWCARAIHSVQSICVHAVVVRVVILPLARSSMISSV
eukprot:4365-Heterococcus_DN1.PRE.2